MSTSTPKMNLTLPSIGGDSGLWGSELNGNFSILDNLAGYATLAVSATGPLSAGIGPLLVEATAGAGGITLTLPDAIANANRVFIIGKVDAAAGSVTINTTSSQNINSATSIALSAQWSALRLISDGAKWVASLAMPGSVQNANTVLAGPASGAAAVPGFRALASADMAFAVNNQVGTTYTVVAGDNGKLITFSNASAIAVTIPSAATMAAGFNFAVSNLGAGAVTLTPTTSTIDGASSLVLTTKQGLEVYQDGTNYVTVRGTVGGVNSITLSGSAMLFESSADTITAHAGGGQASATPITTQTSRITTVATAGDSIVLPASVAGLEMMVINHGANAMQVFGAGTDKINDVTATVGVSQMSNSLVIYTCATAGNWYTEGLATGYAGSGLQSLSYLNNVTAHAGGGQASATALTAMVNRVTTVATQGDSVLLPASAPGLTITILNRGAKAMQVFGAGTDTINGIATATGIAQGINTTASYVCSVAGNWEVPLTSLQSTSPGPLAASGAIPAHVGHTYVVTAGSAAALTLAAPTATTDDGIEITVTSNTAFAHTITATGLLQTGTASVNVATFAAFAGAGLTLMAYQGKWNVLCSVGVTFS